jgi:hydroxymethylbilane synthase
MQNKESMKREIRIGSRGSELSLAQTRLVMAPVTAAYPRLSVRIVILKTRGDLLQDTPLEEIRGNTSGKAFFTGALEKALADKEIDLCVHSLKDMEAAQPEDLPVIGVTKRADPRDVLVLPGGVSAGQPLVSLLKKTAINSPLGCSSLRRRVQLLRLSPGLAIAPIRGNVPTRLSKLDGGQYGSLVLAAAGLARLGIERPLKHFSLDEMIPAAGQGAIAIQGRAGEDYAFLDIVRDPVTEEEVSAERAFIRELACGCGSPAAAYARISGGEIRITGMYAPDAESPLFRDEVSGEREHALRLAEELARRLARKAKG